MISSFRTFDPDADRAALYFLLNSLVIPRPIAWVTSLASDGTVNLAPHSYHSIACVAPPVITFTSIREKDTVRNVRHAGSFVVHTVPYRLAEHMNITAADAPSNVSEVSLARLGTVASDTIPVPRLAEAPVAMECELERIVELGTDPAFVIFGAVTRIHVDEELFDERDRVDPGRLDSVARLGGSAYCTVRDRFDLVRPKYADLV